jgi:hypothetical protein
VKPVQSPDCCWSRTTSSLAAMLDYFEAVGFEADGARSLRDTQDLPRA